MLLKRFANQKEVLKYGNIFIKVSLLVLFLIFWVMSIEYEFTYSSMEMTGPGIVVSIYVIYLLLILFALFKRSKVTSVLSILILGFNIYGIYYARWDVGHLPELWEQQLPLHYMRITAIVLSSYVLINAISGVDIKRVD